VLSLVFATEPEAKDQFVEREYASPRGRHRVTSK
jgi:hypothetical protein